MQFYFKHIPFSVMILYSLLAAQDKPAIKENAFFVTLGLSEYQTKEFVLNKVKHRGVFPTLDLAFIMPSDLGQHTIEMQLLFNQLTSSFEKEPATIAVRTGLNYSYLRKVNQPFEQMQLCLGGLGGMDYNVSYFENWDESHFYWLTQYYLGLDGKLMLEQASGALLTFEMQMPILSLISRPNKRFQSSEVDPQFAAIVSDMHNELQWTTLNRHIDLRLLLHYTFALSDSFRPTLSWRFRYLNNTLATSKKSDRFNAYIWNRFHFLRR